MRLIHLPGYAMPDIGRGSLGVIEEFFGAELVEDNKQRSRMATIITPEQIMRLPETRREALAVALKDFDGDSVAKL